VRHFSVDTEAAERRRGDSPYREFLRVPMMSAGLYELAAGDTDIQTPHREDELYVVLGGRGSFTASGTTIGVVAGSMMFVPAREAHLFHDIVEDLRVLVFFSPAET
jgi:mannose-6-phosphate isomerase-like protein (cupin superfamily)